MMKNSSICMGKYMAVTQKMLSSYLRLKLEDTTLNASQFIFLMHLFNKDGQSQEQLNKHMQYDKGVVARMADGLEKNGYIERQVNENDNRAYELHITQKAKDFYPRMIETLAEWNEMLVSGESDEDIEKLSQMMERISLKSIQKVKEIKNGKK
jgi:DNA-binding MarR family transcriptional regulator